MSGPVDVLTRAAEALRNQLCGEGVMASEVDEARAAVAELVEAAKAYHEQDAETWSELEPEDSRAAKSRNERVRLCNRLGAALAAFGGGQ